MSATPACPRSRPPAELRAGPLRLTALELSDWPVEVALSATADVVAWTHYPAGLDETSARQRIARLRQRATEGHAQRYVIHDPAGAGLGTCGVGALATPTPEVFYALLPGARGRGAATAAVRALVAWTSAAGYAQVALQTIEGNTASERVALRAGFTAGDTSAAEQHGKDVTLRRWSRATAVPPADTDD